MLTLVDYKTNFAIVRATAIISIIGLLTLIIAALYMSAALNNEAYQNENHINIYFGGGSLFVIFYILSTYPYMNEDTLKNEKMKIYGGVIAFCKGITYLNVILLCIVPVLIIWNIISQPHIQGDQSLTVIMIAVSIAFCVYIVLLFYYTYKSNKIIQLHDLSLQKLELSEEKKPTNVNLTDEEIITPIGNGIKFSATVNEVIINQRDLELSEISNKESPQEQVVNNPIKEDGQGKTKVIENNVLNKRITVFENLEFPQKIIFGISSGLISFILCYVISYHIDHRVRLTETWLVWLLFILTQAWIQNKIWSSNGTFVIKIAREDRLKISSRFGDKLKFFFRPKYLISLLIIVLAIMISINFINYSTRDRLNLSIDSALPSNHKFFILYSKLTLYNTILIKDYSTFKQIYGNEEGFKVLWNELQNKNVELPANFNLFENRWYKLTMDEFAEKVKSKYPSYENLPKAELAKKVIVSYPEYVNEVDTSFFLCQP